MEDEISYIANDARCLSAIEDLAAGMETLKWLGQYLELYINVTYDPENSPRVADCNYLDKQYKYIQEFTFVYRQKHLEVEDPF